MSNKDFILADINDLSNISKNDNSFDSNCIDIYHKITKNLKYKEG